MVMEISARIIQVVGTQSGAGKSTIVMSLCHYFSKEGFRVAPFKAFNMSLNSVVVEGSAEIARSQWLQAISAGTKPEKEMNPILVKPEKGGLQPVILGKSLGNLSYGEYSSYMEKNAKEIVKKALEKLSRKFDIIVAEGTGSAAEINLRGKDIGNMFVSSLHDTPALLVSNIELGGVFASIYGTILLMDRPDLLRGFIINNFRGDPSVLLSGIAEIEKRTIKRNFGIIPHIKNVTLPGEDYYDYFADRPISSQVNVVRLPFMENYSDLDPLIIYGIGFRYVDKYESFLPGTSDVIVIPGSKDVPSDLAFIRKNGIDRIIRKHAAEGGKILGICGGYQMLGRSIKTREKNGRTKTLRGIGLLDSTTLYKRNKTVRGVNYRRYGHKERFSEGYEIHYAVIETKERPLFETENGPEGSVRGNIMGTNIHGVLENRGFLSDLTGIKHRKSYTNLLKDEIERVSSIICSSLDMNAILKVIGLNGIKKVNDR